VRTVLKLMLLLIAINAQADEVDYGSVHIQGHLVVLSRSFPGISDQDLYSFGGVLHWQPFSFLSFGPYFRGLTSFVSGTSTTSVTNTFNDVGMTVNIIPYISQLSRANNIDVRFIMTTGVLISLQNIDFSHQLIATENKKETSANVVFPIEVGLEFVFSQVVSFKYFVGYTLFAQSQGIYHGPALGILF
jgi:hypothetical protein